MEPIIRHFGTTPLAAVDQDALDRAAMRLYPSVAASTRNRQFYTPASAVLHHAARRGWCPCPFIQRPEPGARCRVSAAMRSRSRATWPQEKSRSCTELGGKPRVNQLGVSWRRAFNKKTSYTVLS
jgi:hypothetical protein